MKRKFALLLAAVMMLTVFAGCTDSGSPASVTPPGASQAPGTSSTPPADATPEPIVTLKTIFPGDEPKNFDQSLAILNERLAEDISVKLEISWAPWDEYYTKVQMGVAAGEEIDWFWDGSSNVSVHTANKHLAPLNEYLDAYGQAIYANINPDLFDSMAIDGQIMGIPSTGNAPLYNPNSTLLYREDLREKYNLEPLNSIENIEAYLEAIQANEPTMIPLCEPNVAYYLLLEHGPETFFGGTNGAVASRVNDDGTVDFMPVQEAPSYVAAVKKAREWYLKGYIPADILNISDKAAKMNTGVTAAIGASALSAAEQQATLASNIPDGLFAGYPLHGTSTKFIRGNGGNAVYLTPLCKNPEKVVQFWAWIYSSQENYDLYCYGVEGVDYVLENGRISYLDIGYSQFPAWMFNNLNYMRFNKYMTDEYIETVRNWDAGAKISPLQGFTFNPENVTTELATFNAVYNSYSLALASGSIDYDEAIDEINEKFKAAGQDKILEEVRRQADEWLNR